MKFSIMGQEKGDLLIQVTAYNRADHTDKFDYLCTKSDIT